MIFQGGDGDGGDDDDDGDDDDGGRILQAHPSPIPLRPGIKYPVRVNPHSDMLVCLGSLKNYLLN